MSDTFTESQIEAWRAYEEVRQSGLYNMFDPGVRDSAGISRDEHLFCIKNYGELKEAAESTETV